MSKRQKKKPHVAEGEPDVEIITKVEYIYEDTKATTRVELDYKFGEIYRMISNQNVLDVGFEELTIYANIEKSSLMKVATRPELFPCSEVIGWILPRADVTTLILEIVISRAMLHIALYMSLWHIIYLLPRFT